MEGQRLVEAGRLRTGVSAPTIAAVHLAVPTADPTAGGGLSEDSPVGGEAEASKCAGQRAPYYYIIPYRIIL